MVWGREGEEGEGRCGGQGGRGVDLDKRGEGGQEERVTLPTGGPRKACRGKGVGV